jgi:hypothetical protein
VPCRLCCPYQITCDIVQPPLQLAVVKVGGRADNLEGAAGNGANRSPSKWNRNKSQRRFYRRLQSSITGKALWWRNSRALSCARHRHLRLDTLVLILDLHTQERHIAASCFQGFLEQVPHVVALTVVVEASGDTDGGVTVFGVA